MVEKKYPSQHSISERAIVAVDKRAIGSSEFTAETSGFRECIVINSKKLCRYQRSESYFQ